MDFHQHYEEFGRPELPVLILLHGNGEDGTYFKNQIGPLSRQFHLYVLDTRGHGQSSRGHAPFTIAQFAQDLKTFMDHQLIQKAHILGFSDGANIAMKFAVRYPSYVQSLVLNGGNLVPHGAKAYAQLPINAACLVTGLFKGLQARHEMLALMVDDLQITDQALQNIACPVLVIAGSHDVIRTSHTRSIASRIPGARLEIIKGSHFVARRNPDAFNAVVLDFLRQAAVPEQKRE